MTDLQGKSIPFRSLIVIELAVSGALCIITGVDFLRHSAHFPPWFGPAFVGGVFLTAAVIIMYLREVVRTKGPVELRGGLETKIIWTLLVCSVICTSALHKFFPFRLSVFDYWPNIPPRHWILKCNFILTASSLLVVAVLAVVYYSGRRQLAVQGLVLLAGVMLVPNDDCGNYFNRVWIESIGASPLMFMANSAVILIGCCGIFGIRPKVAIGSILCINGCVLAVGLGHLTGIIW